jgi:hypothetical protein
MPLSNEELGDYIASLERLLQGNPAGQTAALTGYVHKLDAFASSGDNEALEKTLQLFGTAVGGRSMLCLCSKPTLLTVYRKMAGSVPRQRHPCLRSSWTVYRSP